MTPGFDKNLQQKLSDATLEQMMPDFDRDAEWERLSGQLQNGKRTLTIRSVVAVLLLLAVITGGVVVLMRQNNRQMLAPVTNIPAQVVAPQIKDTIADASKSTASTTRKPRKHIGVVKATDSSILQVDRPRSDRKFIKHRLDEMFAYYRTNEFICNGTPCPLEICILQTVRCAEREKQVATCSTLEPDQAGQLKYRALTAELTSCRSVVDEIRITRVNTGETITLTANSKPTSAQDFFDYITGKKEGDIMTGIFRTDCEQRDTTQQLILDKNYGSFILK